MNKIEINILIDKLNGLAGRLYEWATNSVDASYEIDKIIDELIMSRDTTI